MGLSRPDFFFISSLQPMTSAERERMMSSQFSNQIGKSKNTRHNRLRSCFPDLFVARPACHHVAGSGGRRKPVRRRARRCQEGHRPSGPPLPGYLVSS